MVIILQEKNIFIYSAACVRRMIDAKKIYTYFQKNKYTIINDPEKADYILFISCGVTNSSMDVNIKLIKKFQKYKGELIVVGCLPHIAKDKLSSIFGGKTIPLQNLEKIDEIFNNKIKFQDIDEQHSMLTNYNPFTPDKEPITLFRNLLDKSNLAKRVDNWIKEKLLKKLFAQIFTSKTGGGIFQKFYLGNTMFPGIDKYYILSIAMGCSFNCSYCVGKKAVGRLKSKPIDECIEEFKQGLKEGYKEFILDADDVGAYGQDISTNIAQLLDKLTKIEGDYIIRFTNAHPYWIYTYIEEFERILKRGKIKSILLAIQSANDRVLKLMRRPYTKKILIEMVTRLKSAYPSLVIGSHIIVGFPTETEEEFNDSFNFFKNASFDIGNFYYYSESKDSDSANIEPKVTIREIKKRMRYILKDLRKLDYLAWNTMMGITFQNRQ